MDFLGGGDNLWQHHACLFSMTPSLPENQHSSPPDLSCLDVPSGAIVRWLLPDGTTKLATLHHVASEAGYPPPAWPERIETRLVDSYKRSFLTAPWNNCRQKEQRHSRESAFVLDCDFGAPQANSLARGANATPLSLHRGLGGLSLHKHKDFGINASQIPNNNVFTSNKSQKMKKASGFSGVGNIASLSFAIAEDTTASESPVRKDGTVEKYATCHDGAPLAPLTNTSTLGKARILGEAASAKHEVLHRSEDDENNEPQWMVPNNPHNDDVVQDAICTSGPAQSSAILTTTAIQNNTTSNMPSKAAFKPKSVSTELRESCEVSEANDKPVKHKFPTTKDIHHDIAETMTVWPDRPKTPNGGNEYQRNLYAEPRIEKCCLFRDNVGTMLIDLNIPCYNEADYDNPDTPQTPGKWIDEEWEHRTRFGDLQPTNFWTAPLGAAMEWKTKAGVDASGWDIYSDDPPAMNAQDAKFVAMSAKSFPAPKGKTKIGVNPEGWNIYVATKDATVSKAKTKEREADTPCGMAKTNTCNLVLCKPKAVTHTHMWSHFSTQAGFTLSNAESRDTIAPSGLAHLASGPEGTEIARDTSTSGIKDGCGGVVRIVSMPLVEAETFAKEEDDSIVEGMSGAAAEASEEDTKAKKKRILMLMKEQKERDRQKAEKEAKKAAEELRRLEEELAGL